MIITYYGAYCFKLRSGENVLALNPPSKKSSFKSPRFQADVVLVGQKEEDFNGFENISVKGKEENPFLIDGAGEYEIGKVLIEGVAFSSVGTIYIIGLENMRLCHLGSFEEKELRPEIMESAGEIDVLFVSVKTPMRVVNQISPKIFIPMYKDTKELNNFLKNVDKEKKTALDKFSLKKKDIADKQEELIVLNPMI